MKLTSSVPSFFSEDQRMAKPPPLTEDLSHLNSKSTKLYSQLAKNAWKRMTPEQRSERLEHLRKAGIVGGSVIKGTRPRHGGV
ncbi:MAG: hypothetical protein HC779_00015 [Phyllobacteriaceae bacterium]|nr:hypothetical protein [Phyllobacteriaceae bacterium]